MDIETFYGRKIQLDTNNGRFLFRYKGVEKAYPTLDKVKAAILELVGGAEGGTANHPVSVVKPFFPGSLSEGNPIKIPNMQPIELVGVELKREGRGSSARLVVNFRMKDGRLVSSTSGFARYDAAIESALEAIRKEWIESNRRFWRRVEALKEKLIPISASEIFEEMESGPKPPAPVTTPTMQTGAGEAVHATPAD